MYKLYSVYKNTGDWGGHRSKIVVATSPTEAMILSFFGTRERQERDYLNWIEKGYDISAREAKDTDFISHELRMAEVPVGYRLKCTVNVEIVETLDKEDTYGNA